MSALSITATFPSVPREQLSTFATTLEAMVQTAGGTNVKVSIGDVPAIRARLGEPRPAFAQRPSTPRSNGRGARSGFKERSALFETNCGLCGEKILEGDTILYDYAKKRAYCEREPCRTNRPPSVVSAVKNG